MVTSIVGFEDFTRKCESPTCENLGGTPKNIAASSTTLRRFSNSSFVSRKGHSTERFLRALLVVFSAPNFDHRARLKQASEPMFVEAFVAQPAVEILDVSILIRLARLDEAQGDTAFVRPFLASPCSRTPFRCLSG